MAEGSGRGVLRCGWALHFVPALPCSRRGDSAPLQGHAGWPLPSPPPAGLGRPPAPGPGVLSGLVQPQAPSLSPPFGAAPITGGAAPALCRADSGAGGGTPAAQRECLGGSLGSIAHPWAPSSIPPCPCCVLQGAAMAERTSPSTGGSITPLQQMLASGTGAILTSLFGGYHGHWGGTGAVPWG